MIDRKGHRHRCQELLSTVPCLALLGARQVGKTTLAQEIAESWSGPVHRFDLELPSDLARLAEPELALAGLDFVRTFVERDLPSLGVRVPASTNDRFWRMLAHVHGQVWSGSRFASSFGVADTTVRRYLDLLTSALVVEQLRPWHENVGRRQVKSPKVYISDSGILHALLDLPDRTSIERHPILGASWEGFILRQISAVSGSRADQRYFWATHGGAELDLLIVRGAERIGFEIKRTATPKMTSSLRSAIETLRLDQAFVVHAGERSFPLAPGVDALAAVDLMKAEIVGG